MEIIEERVVRTEVTQRMNASTSDEKEAQNEESYESSSNYVKNKRKPYWRGRVHRIAFFSTIIIYLILMCTLSINKIYLTIYFASQMILYGVSSTYHMCKWESIKAERFFQKLDHSSIFLLISGTQTCVVMALDELYKSTGENMLKWMPFSYLFALIGILKVFLIKTVPRYINVLYYILHGVSVAAFIPLNYIISEIFLGLLCILGGAVYILGGIVYGMRKPDPWPMVFGYHEVFHLLTVIANLLFLATIVWADYKVFSIK